MSFKVEQKTDPEIVSCSAISSFCSEKIVKAEVYENNEKIINDKRDVGKDNMKNNSKLGDHHY